MAEPVQTSETEITSAPVQTPRCEFTLGRFACLLSAAVLAVFPKVVLGAQTLFYRDSGALGYPCGWYIRDSLLRGELPLWNPYSHCGVPFMAQWGSWYPSAFLTLFLPMPWIWNCLILVHLVLAGCGMFWFVRQCGVGSFAAAFAGFAYVFNGVTFSCLIWGNYIASLAWLPWVAGLAIAGWRGGGGRLALAALASALQVLTATPELTLLTWLFLGLVWLGDVASRKVEIRPSLVRLAAIVLLAAGLTMVQMLPTFDLLAHSQRDQNFGDATWSMPPWGWANLVAPLFHCYKSPQGPWFQAGQEFLTSYYLGAGVLALGLAGIGLRRSRLEVIAAVLLAFCWIMALGSTGVLFDWFKRLLPGIGIARFPVKFAILPAFLLPLLAAGGLDAILGAKVKPKRIVLATGSLVAVIIGLLWFARWHPLPNDQWNATAWNGVQRVALMGLLAACAIVAVKMKERRGALVIQLAMLGVVALDGITHSPKIAPTIPSATLAPGAWTLSGKPGLPMLGEGRIMLSPQAERALLYNPEPNMEHDFAAKREAEWYNLNLLDKAPKVAGALTLRPAHFDIIEKYIYYYSGAHYGTGLLDFLSVAWISSTNNAAAWVARTNYLPLVTCGQQPRYVSREQAVQGIMADDFDPRTSVYLPEEARATIGITNRSACSVRNVKVRAQKIEADIECEEPGLMVLSQTYYHHWQAFVNGQPTRLWRANYAFQALKATRGKSHVVLVYRDRNLLLGAVLSIGSLCICAFILWRGRQRHG